MSDKYILDGTIPVPAPDLLAWARWFETADRQVAETLVTPDVRVSTIFLGLDHQCGDGPAVLYKTMVFGGPLDGDQERYTTWGQAEQGHEAVVELVRQALRRDGRA